jgi:hypothetical protein
MTQRGSVILLYLIGAAAVLGALFLIYQTIETNGYDRGRQETEARYAKRDNDQLRAANDRIQALQNEARAAEAAHAAALVAVSHKYQRTLNAQKTQFERDITAVRAGTLILRDPGHTETTANCGRGAESAPGAPASGRDGETGGRFSAATSEFLLSEANRADSIVHQLASCQAVITSDRTNP